MDNQTKITQIARRRYIPDEYLDLSSDIILHQDENCLITTWKRANPRPEMYAGISGYFFNDGCKINKIFDCSKKFSYWYCDIGQFDFDKEKGKLTFTDLLIDVVRFPDCSVKVLDMDEFSEAFAKRLITEEQLHFALNSAHNLLNKMYSRGFSSYSSVFREYSLPKDY